MDENFIHMKQGWCYWVLKAHVDAINASIFGSWPKEPENVGPKHDPEFFLEDVRMRAERINANITAIEEFLNKLE